MTQDSPNTPQKPDRMQLLARGILTGGSVGVLLSLTGLVGMRRALLMGALCGILAVYTRWRRG